MKLAKLGNGLYRITEDVVCYETGELQESVELYKVEPQVEQAATLKALAAFVGHVRAFGSRVPEEISEED